MKKEKPATSLEGTKRFGLQLLTQWNKEYSAEADLAALTLGASKLDQLLRELLHKNSLYNQPGQPYVFGSDNPISSFGGHINAAHKLAILDEQFTCSLHLIHGILSVFEHEAKAVETRLGASAHYDRVKVSLTRYYENTIFSEICSYYFSGQPEGSKRFRAFLSVLIARLEIARDSTNHVPDKVDSDILPLWRD